METFTKAIIWTVVVGLAIITITWVLSGQTVHMHGEQICIETNKNFSLEWETECFVLSTTKESLQDNK